MESEELPETQALPSTQQCTQLRNTGKSPDNQMGILLVEFEKEYPIKMGATVIGRDPAKCDIVIDDNSISKLHAIIRIKSPNQFFLIDMKSTNGTKCKSKPLIPHLATPIDYDDKIEFGSVFALLRPSDDGPMISPPELPMTQVLATPVRRQPTPGSWPCQITVPESPDISDRDDSFLVPGKSITAKNKTVHIANSKNNNDSLFWKAPSRSPSLKFDLDDSTNSLNDSNETFSENCKQDHAVTINDMDTQIPEVKSGKNISIHTLDTQIPESQGIHVMETQISENSEIHTLETQIPKNTEIHTLETQLPVSVRIHEIDTQIPEEPQHCLSKDINDEIYSDEISVYDAQTQIGNENSELGLDKLNKENTYISESDEEIICDEFDTQGFEIPNSQPITSDLVGSPVISSEVSNCDVITDQINNAKASDSNDVCDNRRETTMGDEDLTDCEEEVVKEMSKKINVTNLMVSNMNLTEPCLHFSAPVVTPVLTTEALLTKDDVNSDISSCCQQIPESAKESISKQMDQKDAKKNGGSNSSCIKIFDLSDSSTQIKTKTEEEMSDAPTQIIEFNQDDVMTQVLFPIHSNVNQSKHVDEIENDNNDEATQVISANNISKGTEDEADACTQIIKDVNISSPFKIPSGVLFRGKNSLSANKLSEAQLSPLSTSSETKESYVNTNVTSSKYYSCTQEVVQDLLTQSEEESDAPTQVIKQTLVSSPFKIPPALAKKFETNNINKQMNTSNDRLNYYQSTQELRDDLLSQNIDVVPSSQQSTTTRERFSHTNEISVSKNLTVQKIRDIGFANEIVSKADDVSDADETPKKTINYVEDLPLSEDIVEHNECKPKSIESGYTMSEDEKSTDENSDTESPILYRKRNASKRKVKINLASILTLENLPTRLSSRSRKPTEKVKQNPKLCNNQTEEMVDLEVVRENLEKIKGKTSRPNSTKTSTKERKKTLITKISKNESPTDIKNTSSKSTSVVLSGNSNLKTNTEPIKNHENERRSSCRKVSKCIDTIVNPQPAKRIITRGKNKIIAQTNEKSKKEPSQKVLNAIQVSTDSDETLSSVRMKTGKRNNDLPDNVRRSSRNNNSVRSESANNTPKEMESRSTNNSTRSKKSKDTSRVYSIIDQSTDSSSAESRGDVPNRAHSARRKRNAEEVATTPSKRLRSSLSRPIDTKSLASGPQRVLFTAYNDEKMKKMLENLGAVVVDEVKDCTVVVTKEIKRTFKFLCAVGLGRPIVGETWIKACQAKKGLVDPWSCILEDAAAEKKFRFSLRRSLQGERNFLHGYHVTTTPSILPVATEMKLIVEYSGGVYQEGGPRWVVMSEGKDRALWASLRRRGATVVTREFVLTGVLRQELDIDTYTIRS